MYRRYVIDIVNGNMVAIGNQGHFLKVKQAEGVTRRESLSESLRQEGEQSRTELGASHLLKFEMGVPVTCQLCAVSRPIFHL